MASNLIWYRGVPPMVDRVNRYADNHRETLRVPTIIYLFFFFEKIFPLNHSTAGADDVGLSPRAPRMAWMDFLWPGPYHSASSSSIEEKKSSCCFRWRVSKNEKKGGGEEKSAGAFFRHWIEREKPLKKKKKKKKTAYKGQIPFLCGAVVRSENSSCSFRIENTTPRPSDCWPRREK